MIDISVKQTARKPFQSVFQMVCVANNHLLTYQERNEHILKVRFPEEYIRRANSYAFQDSRGTICGGLMIVECPPFRSLLSIPKRYQKTVQTRLGAMGDVAEVNGVWIAPEYRSPIISFSFWRQMIGILLDSRKRRFLFTVDHRNKHMLGHVGVLNPEVLFSGKTVRVDGMNSESKETILTIRQDTLPTVLEMLRRRGIGEPGASETELIRQISSRRSKKRATSVGPT